MNIFYKIDGDRVERHVFEDKVANPQMFNAWEKVIEEHKEEIENKSAAIVFKINDTLFHVLTDTSLLFKLSYAVKQKMNTGQSKQKIAQLI
jgi:hypothetical protein